jgi:hypothetical protein
VVGNGAAVHPLDALSPRDIVAFINRVEEVGLSFSSDLSKFWVVWWSR